MRAMTTLAGSRAVPAMGGAGGANAAAGASGTAANGGRGGAGGSASGNPVIDVLTHVILDPLITVLSGQQPQGSGDPQDAGAGHTDAGK
jgi:hypothetical protein